MPARGKARYWIEMPSAMYSAIWLCNLRQYPQSMSVNTSNSCWGSAAAKVMWRL